MKSYTAFIIVTCIQILMAGFLYLCLVDSTTIGLVVAGIYIVFGYIKHLNIVTMSPMALDASMHKPLQGRTPAGVKKFLASISISVLLTTGVVTFFTTPYIFILFNFVYLVSYIKIAQSAKRFIHNGSRITTG